MSEIFSVPSASSAFSGFQLTQSRLSGIICDFANSEIFFNEASHLNVTDISNPTQPPDFFELGTNALIFSDFDRAIDCFTKVLEMEPFTAAAANNIGFSLLQLEKYQEALPYFDQAIEIKPDYHCAYDNKALILQLLGQYEQALVACDRAIQFAPDPRWRYHNRNAQILLDLDRLEAALLQSDIALEIFERAVAG